MVKVEFQNGATPKNPDPQRKTVVVKNDLELRVFISKIQSKGGRIFVTELVE